MEQAIERATIHGVRTISLPPIGTHIARFGATLWAIQRAKPGSGLADYALLVPHGPEFEYTGEWGSYGKDEPGAACMWDGLANTLALAESKNAHPVIEFVSAADAKITQDPEASPLYLPSLRELKALFANGCDAFAADRWYWSSTQFSRNYAYFQYFGYGDTYYDGKSWEDGRARPVRRSSLESLIA
jgi:hypothetical protein